MKIISKYKDYYDFVAGYDTDPRKIYIRKPEEIECEELSYSVHVDQYFLGEVWFCDKLYPYLHDFSKGVFWYDYYAIPIDIKEQWRQIREAPLFSSCGYYRKMSLEGHFDIELDKRNKRKLWSYSTNFREIKVKLNTKYGCPVLFSKIRDQRVGEKMRNGVLSELKFGQVKSPKEAFTELYNWIPYIEPKMPDDPTDMSRFENKGFSKKTSFRGK